MEPPSSGFITILNHTGRDLELSAPLDGIRGAFRRFGKQPTEVSLLLTSDAAIRRLNREYRDVDSATDVLTFPLDEDGGGDIAISLDTAERQAAARGVDLTTELAYLAIHGALHLVGLDDITDRQRAEMMREMNAVAVEIGLPSDAAWESIYATEVA